MLESKVGKPTKIAIFRDPAISADLEFIGGEPMEKYGNVRITEYIEVTFQPLQDSVLAGKFLDALDIAEKKIRNEFQAKLDNLETTRRNLLAIAYTPPKE